MSAPTPTPTTTYHGSCHCRSITYSVELPTPLSTWNLTRCNCTICHKKGYLAIGPRDVNFSTFKVLTPTDRSAIGNYSYGTGAVHHAFCKECGTGLWITGNIPEIGGDFVTVNVCTLDGVDLSGVSKVKRYWDGRAEKWAEGTKEEPVAPGQW